jgi:asparagine synthase (glutamine-hydrolysing)
MPMAYQNRYHITYNGEIYNHLQLKDELKNLGHQFSNNTDTEVILAAYSQWGVLSFSKLNGMFAFAIWDDLEKELILSRDPVGIKPLYYSTITGDLFFSSELRAFKAISKIASNDNTNWPIYMMAYGHLPEPVTTLKEVFPLQKGCFLKYQLKNKSISLQSFKHYSYSEQIFNENEARLQIKFLLEEAVKNQLLADAPLGVFLSGGLDSGIIASIASKYKKNNLNALSIYFEEKEYSEKKYQDILIDKIACKSNQLLLKEKEFHNSFQTILDSMDLPSCDGINTWFISKYAAENGFKAVLSGVGGDELFGGYPSFNRIKASHILQYFPDIIKTIGKKSKSKRLTRFSYLRFNDIKGIYLFLRGHFNPYEIARHLGAYESEVWSKLKVMPSLINIDRLENKNQASWMEFNLYMQNQLLRDADVMSMIHSVEIRVPFLDDNLLTYTNKIKPKIRYKGALPKQFLIDVFSDQLPKETWDRPKMGFSFPFSKWMINSEFIENELSDKNTIINESYIKFKNGKLHWSQMMNLIILSHRESI